MKKQILSFALVAAMIGGLAAGCSSEKAAGSGSDSTKTDSTATMSTPATTSDSTVKSDTTTRDTSKKVPQ
ncbi:hypothetical protein [Mucilaginibacter terrenus]|uniref:hypothetical protein n=1 Tax=Mucilaginibacter terrenus TaxID=2482727 RepID=UPI001058B7A2|nr:hypothetical protein [Mucilaginibacter terrenus]